MSSYSSRSLRSFSWASALTISIVLHLVLIVLWSFLVGLEAFAIKIQELVEEQDEPEAFIEMAPTMRELLDKAVESKKFMATKASQEAAVLEKSTRYFGERTTQAASLGEIVENALAVPSQEGRDPRDKDDLELQNNRFSDGEVEGETMNRPVSEPSVLVEQESEPQPQQSDLEQSDLEQSDLEQSEPTPQERLEAAKVKARSLLANENGIPQLEEKEVQTVAQVEQDLPKPKSESELKSEPTTRPREPLVRSGGIPAQLQGYQREARRTRLHGTIRRRGESSVDVEDSVKGRYLAQVNRQIERMWQRECILRREYLLPGVLSVSFVMNEAGKVTNFRFDSRIAGGAIQEGFTMRAIQKAKIPAMPPEIKEELQGSPLEMSLTFFFD